jgi:hypothetical protein
MQPPTTSYPYGYSDTSMEAVPVSNPTFYCPSRNGRWKPVTLHAMSDTVPPLIPLEAEYDECRTPKFPGLGLIHSPLTHLDQASTNRRSTKKQGLHATGPGVFSPSHPLRHHGVRGWPTIPGARRYSGFHSARQNFTSKASPDVSASSWPYKREGRGLYEGGRIRKNKSSPHRRRSTSQAISFVLSLSKTWDQLSLSQLVTPTQALRCKKIQYSPPLDVGPSFARTRITPRVFSLHHHPD